MVIFFIKLKPYNTIIKNITNHLFTMDALPTTFSLSETPKKQLIFKKKAVKPTDLQHKKDECAYTADVLRLRYRMYRNNYIDTAEIIKTYGLPIRHQNPPEDVTENITKNIIINYDNDHSCKWAKCIKIKGKKVKGDLWSEKYSIEFPPEVKAFTSDGPSSFGPRKKFGVIYFLDMRLWLNDTFILWRVNLRSDSDTWKKIKMNKIQTHEEKCEKGNRPHIAWCKLSPLISAHCVKVYEGTFEGIFTPPITVSVSSQ